MVHTQHEQGPLNEFLIGADPIWLARQAKSSRKALIRKIEEQEIDDLVKEVYDLTTAEGTGEVDRGWAVGPFTEEEMTERMGHDLWTACRRFGVIQRDLTTLKEKVRLIDDLSEYFVNACTTCKDKISVAGVDAITGFIKMWADKILEGTRNPDHAFSITMDDGSVKHGILHEAYRGTGGKLVGKCVDLDSAYKQCPVAPYHSHYAVFAVKNPETGEASSLKPRRYPSEQQRRCTGLIEPLWRWSTWCMPTWPCRAPTTLTTLRLSSQKLSGTK